MQLVPECRLSVLGKFRKSRDSLEEAKGLGESFPDQDDRPESHESPDDDFSRFQPAYRGKENTEERNYERPPENARTSADEAANQPRRASQAKPRQGGGRGGALIFSPVFSQTVSPAATSAH